MLYFDILLLKLSGTIVAYSISIGRHQPKNVKSSIKPTLCCMNIVILSYVVISFLKIPSLRSKKSLQSIFFLNWSLFCFNKKCSNFLLDTMLQVSIIFPYTVVEEHTYVVSCTVWIGRHSAEQNSPIRSTLFVVNTKISSFDVKRLQIYKMYSDAHSLHPTLCECNLLFFILYKNCYNQTKTLSSSLALTQTLLFMAMFHQFCWQLSGTASITFIFQFKLFLSFFLASSPLHDIRLPEISFLGNRFFYSIL